MINRVAKPLAVVWLLLATAAAAADPDDVPPEDPAAGTGASYWGEIPPADEQNTAETRDDRRPVWEDIVAIPYGFIVLPLWMVSAGLGEAVVWATESTSAGPVGEILTLSFLPMDTSMGVTAGGDDGFGLKFTGDHRSVLGPHNRLRISLRYTTKDNSKATLGMVFNDGQTNSTAVGIGYRLNPDTRYYGIGPTTTADELSYYTTETAWGGAGYRRDLGKGGFLELLGMYTSLATRGPREGETPTLEEWIPDPDDRPFGYGEHSQGVGLTLALGRDGTNVTGRPQHGNLLRAFASWFTATDVTDVSFWSYRAEAQQYLPLWHTRRGLALRGVYTRIFNRGSDPVPFQRLLVNNEPDLLRGYKDWRWRDSGLVTASIEYRFPVWNFSSMDDAGVDAYLFADYGQVFGDPNEISLANLTRSLGIGWRVITTERFMVRLEIGNSDEGTFVRLASEQIFQYAKGGIIHGRNPVPTR